MDIKILIILKPWVYWIIWRNECDCLCDRDSGGSCRDKMPFSRKSTFFRGYITDRPPVITVEPSDEDIGMIRSNSTASYIVELLKEEISPEGVVDKMCTKYDAPRETIARDVGKILDNLKRINALDE